MAYDGKWKIILSDSDSNESLVFGIELNLLTLGVAGESLVFGVSDNVDLFKLNRNQIKKHKIKF